MLPSILSSTLLIAAASAETITETPASISTPSFLMMAITVFVLALFVGVEIITKIPPTLHTPLMSGSNAISGITILGGILAVGMGGSMIASFLGFLAIILASVNVVGGFLITHRMLQKFRR